MKYVLIILFAGLARGQNPPATGLQPVGSPTPGSACNNSQPAFYSSSNQNLYTCQSSVWTAVAGGGGSGTVTNFTAGGLSPLFTTSVATSTTTPALTFTQVNENANLLFAGPSSGSAAAPTWRSLVIADLPTAIPNANLANPSTTVNGQTCTLGSTCAIPAATNSALGVAECDGTTITCTAGVMTAVSSGGANTALSNLASVAINTSLLFASGQSLGSTAAPPQYWYLYGGGTRGTNSLQVTSTPTGNNVWTVPNTATDTFAGLGTAQIFSADQTFSGQVINSSSGAASKSPFSTTGSWYTAGTSSTNHGNVINSICSGATAPTYSTSGEGIIVDACSGYAGNLTNLLTNGTSEFLVTAGGITSTPTVQVTSAVQDAGQKFKISSASGVMSVANTFHVSWSSTAAQSGTVDTGLFRNGAGVLEIDNGTGSTYRDLILRTAEPSQILGQGTAPSVAISGTGTCTLAAPTGTNISGLISATGACTSATITLTWSGSFAYATHSLCAAMQDRTQQTTFIQTSDTTTTAVFTAAAIVSSDVLQYGTCTGY